ncbi:MAG: bifunctional folylpolyglutamate synthase/dihydrofolate synthase [Candidatus Omnitrophica bacterium]|nr:bifunctional folylpolyglutamate synthase/dihydrofolate synthase [Candidatus Omnitrophota bacterium]
MKYKEAVEYINSFFNLEKVARYDYSRELKLDRMRALLARFGNPQDSFKAVHIAGSKGKGTVSASVYQALKNCGMKVGLYTSPHLLSFRERIRFSDNKADDPLGFGDTISEQEITELTDYIKPLADDFSRNSKWGKPTFFEVYTLLAFLYFARKNAELTVVEVGLGGRLDATNVINPVITAITKIVFEHTDKLGDTIEKIAKEKCGILRKGVNCVAGIQKWQQAASTIKKEAEIAGAHLLVLGEDIGFNSEKDSFSITIGGIKYQDIKTNLLGRFQHENLALAAAIIHILGANYGFSSDIIKTTFRDIHWPGRMQLISKEPVVILDSAHTPESISMLGNEIKNIFPDKEITTILAISKDKNKLGIIKEVSEFSQEIVFTRIENDRLSCQDELKILAESLGLSNYRIEYDFNSLIETIMSNRKSRNVFLITGSIFLVSGVLEVFKYGSLQS